MTEVPVAFVERAIRDRAAGKVAAIDRGARRIDAGRRAAAGAYEPMERMRDRARAIRLDALRRLDELLAEFADRVADHGGHVHFASDGREAAGLVLQLARSHDVDRIVKS